MDGYEDPQLAHGGTKGLDPARKYDVNGDGVADSLVEIAEMYQAWAPAFVAMLRGAVGNDAVLLANSAGSVSDGSLNGLTIEMEGCVASSGGMEKCSNALDGQMMATKAAGRTPVSVLWLTHSESMPPTEQCKQVAALQLQFPWVQAGTDFFDGSKIVC